MKDVKVLGTGCSRCKVTMKLIEDVARDLGVEIAIEKVEDVQRIMAFGIMSTPGVVIDGKVVLSGRVPTRAVVASWLAT